MLHLSSDVVDADVEAASSASEETTSQKLFKHLFGTGNILRGPITHDESVVSQRFKKNLI